MADGRLCLAPRRQPPNVTRQSECWRISRSDNESRTQCRGGTMTGQALRETLGFMGVVGSLLFVGLEIRQNTRVARAEAYRSIEQTQTEWNFVAASDPDLALLLRRVTLDGAR